VPLQLIIGAAIVAAAFLAGWQVNGWRLKASEAKATEVAERAATAATEAAVTAIKGIEVRYVPIRQKAEVITHEVPVYRECVHTDDGLRVVNEALAGHPTPAGDTARLPGPDTPH
jgi:hypothetical protein